MNKDISKACDKAIRDLADGDKNAPSVVYDLLARMIFSVAFAIVCNYQDAEDVLQNTMIEVMRYADSYKKGSNAKALVLAMARNTAIDTIRKRKPAIPLDEAEAAVFTDDIGSRLEALDMLALLDVDEKQLVMLRLYSELPYKEAAWIMGTSVAAVQKKYQRAIKKLKAFYKEEIPYEAEQN